MLVVAVFAPARSTTAIVARKAIRFQWSCPLTRVMTKSRLLAQTGDWRSGRACPLCPGISDINLFRYCQGECAHPEGHQRIVRQVRVGFRGWNSSSMDCFGSLIRERSLRSFFCPSSFCRKRKRGDRVACPDRPCLVMPKPFWPPCVT
jgi:hypothetical protein